MPVPVGLDTEVFSFAALERAWREATLASDREHVTPYIWRQPDRFRLASVTHTVDLSAHRWTVDTDEDLTFVRKIYERLGAKAETAGMDEVLDLLRRHPGLSAINRGIARNEGYAKSLRTDNAPSGTSRG